MRREDVRKALGGGCFGDHLDDRCLDQVAAISRLVEFPPDHFIFREGEPASTVYIIVAGMVSIEINSPVGCKQTLTLGEGELLGWTPVLQKGQLSASARTLRPTQVVEVDVARLLPLFETDARLGYDFMRATAFALAKRLDATRLQLADVYYSP